MGTTGDGEWRARAGRDAIADDLALLKAVGPPRLICFPDQSPPPVFIRLGGEDVPAVVIERARLERVLKAARACSDCEGIGFDLCGLQPGDLDFSD